MSLTSHKSKVNPSSINGGKTGTKLAVYSKSILPTQVWMMIFNYLEKNFNPYQYWQLRTLCRDFKYTFRPLKENSYIFIKNQKELDGILLTKCWKTLPDIFLEEGLFIIRKQLQHIKVNFFGKGIGKTTISGGIKSQNSKIVLNNVTISNGDYGIMSYCDTELNISKHITLNYCEICNCNVIMTLFQSSAELNNCIIHSNSESFHTNSSIITINDSEYYHDGKGIEINKQKSYHYNTRKKSYRYNPWLSPKEIKFNNTKIIHKTTPLTQIDHTREIYEYDSDGDREFGGYEREYIVESDRNIWQIWLNSDFQLKNRLSFYKDDFYFFETYDCYSDDSYEENDIVTNNNIKSKFLAVTDIDKCQFCNIISNLLESVDKNDKDQFLFFNHFTRDIIYLICVYITTPSNGIKNIPNILIEIFCHRPPYYYFGDDFKKPFKHSDPVLFIFLKKLFLDHGFRVVGGGVKIALCNEDVDVSKLMHFKIIRFGGYDSISISSSNLYSESDSETDSESSWSEDVYQGNKSKMRKRRKQLVKYRN